MNNEEIVQKGFIFIYYLNAFAILILLIASFFKEIDEFFMLSLMIFMLASAVVFYILENKKLKRIIKNESI